METELELELYVDTVYEGLEGYIYGASSWDKKWMQHFFEWPAERSKLLTWVEGAKIARNVFLAPSVFSAPNAKKENWKASNMVWAELDGNPTEFDKVPKPSIIIQSSTVDHLHCYWQVKPIFDRDVLEDTNRRLAYALNADYSGWDCNQVLRPPDTWNFKRDLPVKLLYLEHGKFYEYIGSDLDPAPPLIPINMDKLPSVEDVINKYFSVFNAEVHAAMTGEVELGKRSSKLMRLGYLLAQVGMSSEEIFTMVHYVDSRIGKFVGRSDQALRLQEIVAVAKQAYPSKFSLTIIEQVDEPPVVTGEFSSLGWFDLSQSESSVKWIWDKLLPVNGMLLLSGAPGVGKSQLTMDAVAHLVMQRDFLGQKVATSCKVGYLSLEMGEDALATIVKKQILQWSEMEDYFTLNQNFLVYAMGEPLDLTKAENRLKLEKQIIKDGLNGLVIDALSSTTFEALSDEKTAKAIIGWLSHLRQSLGIFVWLIHHNRKSTAGNESPKKLSDVHGAVYIAAIADTVLILWKTEKGALELIPVKTRHSELDDGNHILKLTRTPNLTFTHSLIDVAEKPDNKPDGPFALS